MAGAKKAGRILVVAIIGAVLLVPIAAVSWVLYFAWDSQRSGEFHKIAFERDGKLYELNLIGSSLAFDQDLYTSTITDAGQIIALGRGDYKIVKTDNPFFAGRPDFGSSLANYAKSETKYRSPTDSFQAVTLFDSGRNAVFSYEPGADNPYIVKLRPTFPMFAKSKYRIGSKRDYLNATKLLADKYGLRLRVREDEPKKLLILSIEQL